ncbi:MAG: translocation/assembly module TamB domain-containing protein [Betaproteobacteria bacterium]|nr:translocation/assembly module TamB domain-containing protein [Betaproteobacteria bacterium]
MRRWLIVLLVVPFVIVAALLVAIQHEFALKWVAEKIVSSSNGNIVLNGVSGSLTGTIKIEEMIYQTQQRRVTAEDVEISWRPIYVLMRQISVDSVTVSRLTIESLEASREPFVLPESLAPPVSIRVGKVQVDQLKYDGLTFQEVHLSLAADKAAWSLKEAGFESPFGSVAVELKLGTDKPFSLDGRIAVKHEKADGSAELTGELQDIRFKGQFAGFGANVKADARVMPFAAFILPSLSLTAENVDPSQVKPEWPQSHLQVKADIRTGEDTSIKGTVRVDNTIPGSIDDNRLPLRMLTTKLAGNIQTVRLENLLLDMGVVGQFSGNGKLSLNGVDLSLHTKRFNLNGIHSSVRKTAIAGDILVSAEEKKQVATVKLTESQLSLDARAIRTDDQVHLPLFRLRAIGGEVSLEGNIRLTGTRSFAFHGKANRFNLSALGRYPVSNINASLTAKGHLLPEWQVALHYVLQSSRFLDQPLTGRGELTATAKSLRDVNILLALGPNALRANGAFGRNGETLAWRLNAPRLAALGKSFQGALNGEGTLSGTLDTLQVRSQLDGNDLVLPGGIRARLIQARGRFGTRQTDPLEIDLQAQDVAAAGMQWQTLQFQADGMLRSHSMKMNMQNKTMDLNARASGGWRPSQGWSGEIQALENKGQQPFSLAAPSPLRVGTRFFSLQDFTLILPSGKLVINKLEKRISRIQSDGYAKGLSLRYLTALIPSLSEKVGGQLMLGAKWSVDMDRMLTGNVHVYRETGDLTIRGDNSVSLGLSEMDVRFNLANNELQAQASIKGDKTGTIRLAANTQLVRNRNGWHFPKQSPLQLQLDADMPTLDWISVVSGQPDMDFGGSLKMKIQGSGTIGDPRLTGHLAGHALSFRWFLWGVKLHDGQLLARLDDNRIILEEASIRGDEGIFRVGGGGRFDHGDIHIDLNFLADKLLLLSSPDKQLAVSGEGRMILDHEKVALNGKWRVDRALIRSVEYRNVSFSDDVVVIGRESHTKPSRPPPAVFMDMNVDLGDHFMIDGWGLNARLEGVLRVFSAQDQSLRMQGTVHAVDGTFNAYGQNLQVRRGNIIFNGPIDRPSLDILAVRNVPTFRWDNAVEAGVQIRGTPQNLQVTLVSTPNVPDSEKLSWLILGHGGARNTTDHDRSILAAASSALFNSRSLGAMQSGLASTIGVDEIGVGAGSYTENTVLSVTKQITNRLYLIYEQGITTVSNLVKLRFRVSNRVRLEAATGTTSVVNLLYEWSFD